MKTTEYTVATIKISFYSTQHPDIFYMLAIVLGSLYTSS